jgi:hypothetical protein
VRKALLNESNISNLALLHYGIKVDGTEKIVRGSASNSFKLTCGNKLYFFKESLLRDFQRSYCC